MKRKTIVLLFVLGSTIGIPLAVSYIIFSPSQDRVFHAFVMLAACSVSFPAVVIFLRITVNMWDMALEQRGILKELKDEIKPVTKDIKGVVHGINEMISRFDPEDVDKIKKVVNKVATFMEDGESVEKVRELVNRQIRDAEGALEQLLWTKINEFLDEFFAGDGTRSHDNTNDTNGETSHDDSGREREPDGERSAKA